MFHVLWFALQWEAVCYKFTDIHDACFRVFSTETKYQVPEKRLPRFWKISDSWYCDLNTECLPRLKRLKTKEYNGRCFQSFQGNFFQPMILRLIVSLSPGL